MLVFNWAIRVGKYAIEAPKPLILEIYSLLADGHALQLFLKLLPVIGVQLGILHAFLRPIPIPSTDMVLRVLEVE
jgi:hypothetical protein